jgi:hypothetical protein
MVAVLLGVTLSNVGNPDPLAIPLPENSWTLNFSRSILKRSQSGWYDKHSDLILVWTKGQCRLTNYKVNLISKNPQVIIKVHPKDIANLLAFKIPIQEISLGHTQDKSRAKNCQKNPQVIFGG